jgi:hypothetical protein
MTDFSDSCMGCGGHLRANVWSGTLCPICEKRHERGEMTKFGRLTNQLTETVSDPLLKRVG